MERRRRPGHGNRRSRAGRFADPAIDWEIAESVAKRRGRPIRVLLVASGGCTALSLAGAPFVRDVIAVDMNLAQLHLVELRRHALHSLSGEQYAVMLGFDRAAAPERWKLFEAIARFLPHATREYWIARRRQIEFGLHHVGRFEELFRELSDALRAAGTHPDEGPLDEEAWSRVFEQVFERQGLIARFGPEAVNYSMDRSFGVHFASVLKTALAQYSIDDNYFLRSVFRGECSPHDALHLRPEVRSVFVERERDPLHLHHGSFLESIETLAAKGPFDLIQASNLSDWMPVAQLHRLFETTSAALTPGGAFSGRRLNGDHCLMEIAACHLEVDDVLSRDLQAHDRSFFYREVVVGYRSPS